MDKIKKKYLPIILLFEKDIKEYLNIKIKNYLQSKLNNKYYKKINSEKQFYSLLMTNNMKIINRLLLLLSKMLPKNYFKNHKLHNLVQNILINKLKDKEIYKIIRNIDKTGGGKLKLKINKDGDLELVEQNIEHISLNINFTRSKIHANHILDKISKYNLNGNFLDVGCGSCGIITEISKYLKKKYKHNEFHGCDIEKWFNYNTNKRKEKYIIFTELKENKKLPYKDKYFKVITINMVLHHIKNLNLILKEIYRILKDNGILYIEEHNAVTHNDYMLCDIEHGLYACIKENRETEFYNSYYGKYRDILEWNYFLKKYKFKRKESNIIMYNYNSENPPTNKIYIICKKIIKK